MMRSKLRAVLLFMAISVSPIAAQAQQPDPIAPPIAQQTADCVHPTYATDQLVCADAELSALDQTLARMLAKLPPQEGPADNPWLEEQENWFKRRSLCAFEKSHLDCAREAYRTRIAELGALTSNSRDGKALHCPLLPGAAQFANMSGGLSVIRDNQGQILVLIWSETRSHWRPFVTFQWKRASLRLTRVGDDASLTCR